MPSADVVPQVRASGQILGGEAWVVPYEPGGAVWVTASAPTIRVMDRRRQRATTKVAVR